MQSANYFDLFSLWYTLVFGMSTSKAKSESEMDRKYSPFRLTLAARKIIDSIVRKRGVSRTAVVEWALRDLGEKEKIQ